MKIPVVFSKKFQQKKFRKISRHETNLFISRENNCFPCFFFLSKIFRNIFRCVGKSNGHPYSVNYMQIFSISREKGFVLSLFHQNTLNFRLLVCLHFEQVCFMQVYAQKQHGCIFFVKTPICKFLSRSSFSNSLKI